MSELPERHGPRRSRLWEKKSSRPEVASVALPSLPHPYDDDDDDDGRSMLLMGAIKIATCTTGLSLDQVRTAHGRGRASRRMEEISPARRQFRGRGNDPITRHVTWPAVTEEEGRRPTLPSEGEGDLGRERDGMEWCGMGRAGGMEDERRCGGGMRQRRRSFIPVPARSLCE